MHVIISSLHVTMSSMTSMTAVDAVIDVFECRIACFHAAVDVVHHE
ncbi:hypothetical protein [Neobacillus sp. OS1-33]|nr:hypothetical protein [Neobacillus sp. OS1-33]WML26310.1 hypothetical protein RCG22_01290 [Neobacillus sp. OS1-33]